MELVNIPENVWTFIHEASDAYGKLQAERFAQEMHCGIVERPVSSPIEQLFFVAVQVLAFAHFIEIDPEPWGDDLMRVGNGVHLVPQRKVGKYTVDFLVTRTWVQHQGFGEPGIDRRNSVIVELDGHQFRDRDKRQRSYEKARDRFLQREGFRVLHFTGSDVVADPYRVAHEVLDTIEAFGPCGNEPYDAANPFGLD